MAASGSGLVTLERRLEKVLAEKNLLTYKSVYTNFQALRVSIAKTAKGGQGQPLSPAIQRLEQSLKAEGVYKHVKADYEIIKQDLLTLQASSTKPGTVDSPRGPTTQGKQQGGSSNMAAPQRHEGNGRRKEKAEGVILGSSSSQGASSDDVKTLNKAIERLFEHLQIATDPDSESLHMDRGRARPTHSKGIQGKVAPGLQNVMDKLKEFEEELHRGVTKQQITIRELQEENETLRARTSQLSRELDRFKGIQSIASKAKGKHVERIEERHQTQKKGMESKIQQLEEYMKTNLDSTVKEKNDLEQRIREDMRNLQSEINRLHSNMRLANAGPGSKLPVAAGSPRNNAPRRPTNNGDKATNDEKIYDINDLLRKLTDVGNEVQSMKRKDEAANRKINDMGTWENRYKELEADVDKVYKTCDDEVKSSGKDNTQKRQRAGEHDSRAKVEKLDEVLSRKTAKLKEAERLINDKQSEVEELKTNLGEITTEIRKLHRRTSPSATKSTASSSASTPRSQRNRVNTLSKNTKNSTIRKTVSRDDLPESDGQGPDNILQKIEHISNFLDSHTQVVSEKDQHIDKYNHNMKTLETTVDDLLKEIAKHIDIAETEKRRPRTDKDKEKERTRSGKEVKGSSYMEATDITGTDSIVERLTTVKHGIVLLGEAKHNNESKTTSLEQLRTAWEEVQKEINITYDEVAKQTGKSTTSSKSESGKEETKQETAEDMVKRIKACRDVLVQTMNTLGETERTLAKRDSELQRVVQDVTKTYTDIKSQADEVVSRSSKSRRSSPTRLLDSPGPNDGHEDRAAQELKAIWKLYQDILYQKSFAEGKMKDADNEMTKEMKTLKDQITKLQMKVTVREEEMHDQRRDLQRLREENNTRNAENTRLQLELQGRYRAKADKTDEEKIHLRNKTDDLNLRLQSTQHELAETQKEKKNLYRRLSATIGSTSLDGHSLMVDFSNRPIRIAEEFLELHDNEWDDSFRILTQQFQRTDKEAILSLLETTKDCFNVCRTLAERQLDKLTKAVLAFTASGEADKSLSYDTGLAQDDMRHVITLRKSTVSRSYATTLHFYLTTHSSTHLSQKEEEACLPFLRKCVELCWTMRLQEPPMVLLWNAKQNDKFEESTYSFYGKVGKKTDFVVWPAVLLCDKGEVLSKGVAKAQLE